MIIDAIALILAILMPHYFISHAIFTPLAADETLMLNLFTLLPPLRHCHLLRH